MQWQNGLLLCNYFGCVDTAIVGTHDLRVAQAVSIDRKELQPDQKLVSPAERKVDQTEVLY
jgi:hypothetical protein